MEYGNEKYTDEELKQALIQANGQPTKAAEILNVDYSGVYRRIRKNPELYEVQKAYRARAFQSVSNLALSTFLTGVIKEPLTDGEGNVINGEYKSVKVPLVNRLALIPNLMQTFKSDDGITEQVEITNKGSINIADWLKLHNQNKEE